MSDDDELEPVKQLLDAMEELRVTGPDHESLVWATFKACDGDGVSVKMGDATSLPGRAALAWREEMASAHPEHIG